MLGQSQFYHETIRKLVVAFGSMFNDIHLVRKNNAGVITQTDLTGFLRDKLLVDKTIKNIQKN